ncbi:hypothetical protein GCM10022254_15650 [Actinomadura meridiana]|uniref:AAA+ ATPase domain-containing protein n=1 Tax=Actinomadura meridiana TaxID=559626 RepID=A0ABP8BVH7_9ACTN
MTAPGEGGGAPPMDDNPFPALAAAEAHDYESPDEVVSVETPAIRRARELLDGYFGRRDDKGVAFLVAGEHGSGKTHLIYDLLRSALKRPGNDAKPVYVDAKKGDFLSLYRQGFLERFDRDVMVDRVREYYADIIADSLEETGFPADITRRLRTADIDPQRFVSQLNLAESEFLARLNDDLAQVTRNEEFGTALVLMLRDDLREPVWEWLRGQKPSPLLVERGIQSHINDEVRALQAMGVITLLHRRRRRHLVLAFDQLEKALPSSSPPNPDTVTELQRLIELMVGQGVCLILSGLPEIRTAVGRHGREHGLSADLQTDGMSRDEVHEYIRAAIARTHYASMPPEGSPRRRQVSSGLGPFPEPIADHIAYLAGRNARKVVQICHTCYRESLESGHVTTTMVEDAARGPVTPDDAVRDRIEQELLKQGRAFHTNHPVDGVDGPRAPYWIPAADAGCALFVTGSLILASDAEDINADADAVRSTAPGSHTAVIVNGFLADPAREALKDHVTEPALTFTAERFSDDFAWLMNRTTEQLEAAVVGDDQLRMVRAGVSRLATAQSSTQNLVEMIAFQVESMRAASERQHAELTRRIQEAGRGAPDEPLPDGAERMFTEVLAALQELSGLDTALDEMFSEERSGVPTGMLLRLQNHGMVRAVGVAAIAESVIVAFRGAVRGWYRGLDGSPSAAQRADLNVLCRNYETVLDYLPIQLLGTLTAQTADPQSRYPSTAGYRSAELRKADPHALLTDLGYRVRNAFGRT